MAWHGTARHGFEAGARCHSMAWGLVIQDEDCMARLFSMIIRSHNMLINVVKCFDRSCPSLSLLIFRPFGITVD